MIHFGVRYVFLSTFADVVRIETMKKTILILTAMALWFPVSAQNARLTKQQVKELFQQGRYAECIPSLDYLAARSPRDVTLSYWYGVCLQETGRPADAIGHLTAATNTRNANADALRRLADCQYAMGDVEASVGTLEDYLEVVSPTDSLFLVYDKVRRQREAEQRFIRRVQKVTFIDSLVTEKEGFLSHYVLGHECGTLTVADDYPQCPTDTRDVVYQTERGNEIYFSREDMATGRRVLCSSYRLTDEWSTPAALQGMPEEGNCSWPFMMSDGTTFYFASDGPESMGGYDLFVTRRNTDTGRFLRPESMGMPFNSTANDYMLVIDEINGIGWFATDRGQNDGEVCIYSFLWDDGAKEYYPYSTDADAEPSARAVLDAAHIASVAATQTDAEAVRAARQKLFMLSLEEDSKRAPKHDFVFVLDDLTDYHSLSDFRSPAARATFSQVLDDRKELQALREKLDTLRDTFHDASPSDKQALKAEILQLEKEELRLAAEIEKLEPTARRQEKESTP